MDALVKLPGVGRKTANVVLGHALGVPGLPVDRHVLRVANRIGLVRSDDPRGRRSALLTRLLPPDRWTRASDTLILHGRRVCRPEAALRSLPGRGRDCALLPAASAPRRARRSARASGHAAAQR